ncbi:MAG TPA: AAA family ATPase [Candidatus Acidoferrales bacterium]|nr:AAA family ATPase [Candidatus Acidoferrales bacterium]
MNHSDQNDHRLLVQIKLDNLLSFGPGTAPVELENLNVLIGPNAAGKSNLIEALSLLGQRLFQRTCRTWTCGGSCGGAAV